MNNHQLINQDSGNFEYFTPEFIIEAARRVLGEIDLDPFSSVEANKRVRAKKIFTIEDDGLKQNWAGRFWCNHPFSKELNKLCVEKMEREYEAFRATQGLCITYAATSEKWFQPLLRRPQCYLSPRTNYYLPDGTIKKGVTKGSCVTYFGTNIKRFAEEFSKYGVIKTTFDT